MSSKLLSTSTIRDNANNKASSLGQFIEATGGTVSTITDGGVTYKLHAFTSGGTFTVTKCSNGAKVEVLLVGAGGSGGYAANPGCRYGGGGGGGGVSVEETEVSPQAYTVYVGAARDLGSRTGGPTGFHAADGSVRLAVGGGATQNTDGANGGGRSYNNATMGRGIPPTGWDATSANGAGAGASGSTAGYTTNFTGSSYEYGIGGFGNQNSRNNATRYGEGGEGVYCTNISGGAPTNGYAGVLYVRYPV